jgi:hypothetical protein
MMPSGPVTVTVSGSFRKAISEVQDAVHIFTSLGAIVLSPADPRVVAQTDGFVFLRSDLVRDVQLLENCHLRAIACSDLLWVAAPDGYVGSSTSLEIGFAVARGIPIFSTDVPGDVTLREYVCSVAHPTVAVQLSGVHRPTHSELSGSLERRGMRAEVNLLDLGRRLDAS